MVSVRFWIQRAVAKVITSIAGLILSCLYPTATAPLGLEENVLTSLHVSLQTFTLLFFNLCWVGPANQHELHQRTLLSLDFHMSLASGRQWLKIKGRKVKTFILLTFSLFSCSPLLKATAPVSPSFHDSSALVALSFCPGDSPIGSTGSLQLLAPPSYTEPFPLNSAHTSIIILFSKLFSYPNWI